AVRPAGAHGSGSRYTRRRPAPCGWHRSPVSPVTTPAHPKMPARPAAGLVRSVRLADLAELTKPGITLMVVLTTGLGFLLASGRGGRSGLDGLGIPLALLVSTLAGTGLVAAGSSALNHVLERASDGLMRRTAGRPLPSGRLDPDLALLFGVSLAVGGLAL